MPELPEIETILTKINQSSLVIGQRIQAVQVRVPAVLAVDGIEPRLTGTSLYPGFRRGKYFIFPLLAGGYFLIHLRLTGSLCLRTRGKAKGPAAVLSLQLANDYDLDLDDPQGFARIWAVDQPQDVTGHLGPEPLSNEFFPDDLAAQIKKTSRPIKTVLMDQDVIAGIGNIYSDEILFASKLHPQQAAKTLVEPQIIVLYAAIRSVLLAALAAGGTYAGGRYSEQLQVYQRTGLPCAVCAAPIHRQRINQRWAHFCPSCQPANH